MIGIYVVKSFILLVVIDSVNTSCLFTTAMNQARASTPTILYIYLFSLSFSLSHTYPPGLSNPITAPPKIKSKPSFISLSRLSLPASIKALPSTQSPNKLFSCLSQTSKIKSSLGEQLRLHHDRRRRRRHQHQQQAQPMPSMVSTIPCQRLHRYEERVKKVQTDNRQQTTGKEGKRPRNPIGDMENKKREKAEKACDLFFL